MFKNPKRAMFLLAVASTLFASGCWGGNWWKWVTAATMWGSDFTNILEHFNVLNGY